MSANESIKLDLQILNRVSENYNDLLKKLKKVQEFYGDEYKTNEETILILDQLNILSNTDFLKGLLNNMNNSAVSEMFNLYKLATEKFHEYLKEELGSGRL